MKRLALPALLVVLALVARIFRASDPRRLDLARELSAPSAAHPLPMSRPFMVGPTGGGRSTENPLGSTMGSWVAEIGPASDAANSVADGSTERLMRASAIGPSS